MRNIRLTNDEIKAVRNALKFYKDETTHNSDGEHIGLPEGKENNLLISVIIKLENEQ